MKSHHIELHNLDGTGNKRCRVYKMEPDQNYWPAVTDIPCPICDEGLIRWHEAGYVPGYRICDKCKRHFLAKGNAATPKLIRVGNRKGL